jgi:activator of HSP90 ATPase
MIDQTITIPNATANIIYEALLNSETHSEIVGDKVHVDPVEGGYFSSFSGYADGQTTKLVPGKLIEQTWRASDWDDDHYSKIRFDLKDVKGGCEIHFTQTGIPEGARLSLKLAGRIITGCDD